jgi:hypothetical protein
VQHVGGLYALHVAGHLGRGDELEVGVVVVVILALVGQEAVELVDVRLVVDLRIVVDNVWVPALELALDRTQQTTQHGTHNTHDTHDARHTKWLKSR